MYRECRKPDSFIPLPSLMVKLWVIKSQILYFSLLSPLILLSEFLNVLGNYRKPYTGSTEHYSDLSLAFPFGSNWGHKISSCSVVKHLTITVQKCVCKDYFCMRMVLAAYVSFR